MVQRRLAAPVPVVVEDSGRGKARQPGEGRQLDVGPVGAPDLGQADIVFLLPLPVDLVEPRVVEVEDGVCMSCQYSRLQGSTIIITYLQGS